MAVASCLGVAPLPADWTTTIASPGGASYKQIMDDDRYEYAREIVDVYMNTTDCDPSFHALKDEWAREGWLFVDELHRPTSETGK